MINEAGRLTIDDLAFGSKLEGHCGWRDRIRGSDACTGGVWRWRGFFCGLAMGG